MSFDPQLSANIEATSKNTDLIMQLMRRMGELESKAETQQSCIDRI